MYRHEYRRHGFRFGCIPLVLGILFVMLLFSGGFHRVWFFAGPLFFGIPFFIAGAITAIIAMRWWKSGGHGTFSRNREFFGDFFQGEKAKRGAHETDSDTFYV